MPKLIYLSVNIAENLRNIPDEPYVQQDTCHFRCPTNKNPAPEMKNPASGFRRQGFEVAVYKVALEGYPKSDKISCGD